MRRLIVLLVAGALTVVAWSTPANATECTPKGCTGGCRLVLDLEDLRVIECYS